MSNRKLVILAIAAAVMIAAAVAQWRIAKSRTSSAKPPSVDTYLIQGLNPAAISKIVIGRGENPVELERAGGGFVIVNRSGYPAATSKINDLITKCLDIRTDELITSNPANHQSLDVTEDKCQNMVKFLNAEGEVITGIIIGSSRLPELDFSKRSTYVRIISSDDVYLADNVPMSLGDSPTDFMDKQLISVSRAEIESVTVTGPQGSYTLRAAEGDGDGLLLEDKPQGRELSESRCGQVFEALMSLSFTDVKKAVEADDIQFDRTYVCRLKDSTVYELSLAGSDDAFYLKCAVDFTDKTPVVKEQRVESEEELKAKEAKLLARRKAEELGEKCAGWLYEIPQWKAANFKKDLDDLLEPVEDAEPGQEAAADSERPEGAGAAEVGAGVE